MEQEGFWFSGTAYDKQVLNIIVPVFLFKKISLAKKLGSLYLFVLL